jgi:F-type H+-transporting ATPase subunit beta
MTGEESAAAHAASAAPAGRVVAVRGNVVDVRFAPPLPPRRQALRTGDDDIVLEVESHLSPDLVRCFALTPTRGLARGATVTDTGGMLEVPVGPALLGRMVNLFGAPID